MQRKDYHLAKSSLLAIFFASLFASCASTDDGDYVNPITQYEKIGGNWIINSVTQTDETNQTSMDLTSLFNYDSFGISLNVDDEEKPTTFSVTGSAPAMLPSEGQWQLANSYVNSDGASAEIILADKTHLTVTSVPGTKPVLEFKLIRKSNGVPFVSYTYNLTKQAE